MRRQLVRAVPACRRESVPGGGAAVAVAENVMRVSCRQVLLRLTAMRVYSRRQLPRVFRANRGAVAIAMADADEGTDNRGAMSPQGRQERHLMRIVLAMRLPRFRASRCTTISMTQ